MKHSILAIILIFISNYVNADVYQMCELKTKIVTEYFKLSADDLVKKKSEIAKADSFNSLSKATGSSYKIESLKSMITEEGGSEVDADKFLHEIYFSQMKESEINNISLAIKLKEIANENELATDNVIWNHVFDRCVEANRE